MIRPAAFGYNAETAANNYFQSSQAALSGHIQLKAQQEFDNMVRSLRDHGIDIVVINDTPDPIKPDAVFPNNWFCTSPEGLLALFPLFASNRRTERRKDIIEQLQKDFIVKKQQDWTASENEDRFLEGTGSMVIDHDNRMIYSTVSQRTSLSVLEKFATANNYQAIVFIATDRNGYPVYHTNVVMCVGEDFAVLCEESIDEEWELIAVRQLLESTGHAIIPITRDQMHAYAGNMLQVKNEKGEKFLVMSQSAYDVLRKEQVRMLEAFAHLLPVSVPTIEQVEGGSVRCMMAELFLEKRITD
jgi:hypothetical protein